MLKYRMIASDLDGTLLNSQQAVSRENWEAIRRMTEAGVYFVPSSGRTLCEIPREIRENPHVRYIIHSDGAAVYDKETGRVVDLTMSHEKSSRLLDILSEYETDLSVRYEGRAFVDGTRNNHEFHSYHRLDAIWETFIYDFCEPVEDFDAFCHSMNGMEMVCAFFHSAEEQEACRARLVALGGYHVASSDPCNLEIGDERAGKGSALLHLARKLGVERRQTLAVGDSPNDRSMIEKAGLGLAMGNACAELKELADDEVCTNDEHVMEYISEHILGIFDTKPMSRGKRAYWIADLSLACLVILFAVMIRGLAEWRPVSFLFGGLFCLALLAVLGLTVYRVLQGKFTVSLPALILWMILGDGLFYDEFVMGDHIMLPVLLGGVIGAGLVIALVVEAVLEQKRGRKPSFLLGARNFLIGFLGLWGTVILSLSLLGTAFHPAKPVEVEVTLGEYQGYAIHSSTTKHEYLVMDDGGERFPLDTVSVRDTYQTAEGDRIKLTYYHGYFGGYYKIHYDELEGNDDWTPIVKVE